MMKITVPLKVLLVVSGFIGVGVGLTLLFSPVALYAGVNVDVSGQVSLLSDLRGNGGALLACGILIVAGAFSQSLAFTATLVSALVYLAYGAARILAMLIDGLPAQTIMVAHFVELFVGVLSLAAFIKYRQH